MGSEAEVSNPEEGPVRLIELGAFWIDRTEVSVDQYADCVRAGRCAAPTVDVPDPVLAAEFNWHYRKDRPEQPVNYVSWEEASAYCTWRDKRLPTEAEWEKAARGTDGRDFPWGDATPSCELSHINAGEDYFGDGCTTGATASVGSTAGDLSPYGALDLGGNVGEWVADWYDPGYYAIAPTVDPQGPATGTQRVVRGGSYKRRDWEVLVWGRNQARPAFKSREIGFRCVRSVPK